MAEDTGIESAVWEAIRRAKKPRTYGELLMDVNRILEERGLLKCGASSIRYHVLKFKTKAIEWMVDGEL